MQGTFPILSCAEAKAFEAEFFGGDEAREWAAMRAAGRGVGRGIAEDFAEIGPWPRVARVLVLAGKGHNAGDALLAAAELCNRFSDTHVVVEVVFVFGERALRPLARRAWEELATALGRADGRAAGAAGAARVLSRPEELAASVSAGSDGRAGYDVVIDGVFGFQFRAPLTAPASEWLARVNALPARLRAAVDLPSGLGEAGAFRADFTYATGIVKAPLLDLENAGRSRFIELGFPLQRARGSGGEGGGRRDHVLGDALLAPLRALRPARCDKRDFGHVLVVAGSRRFGGAAMMATLAALRAGAGLVTAAVPETLAPAFAAALPEAMWLALPETPEGGLALEGLHLVRGAFERARAVVLGPGLGRERETLALAAEIVLASPHPLVIDADALQPEIVGAGAAPRVLTPHAGEFARIEKHLPPGAIVVRKGPMTRVYQVSVTAAERAAGGADEEAVEAGGSVYHSFFGGPVLARGGSGDLLAGITGALLAAAPDDPLAAAARGVVWQGRAADELARARGARAVRTTELLDFLGAALRTAGE